MKTNKKWFAELPDGYRELALKNLTNDVKSETLAGAVSGAFVWRGTPEGVTFWHATWRWAKCEGDLPPIPTELNVAPRLEDALGLPEGSFAEQIKQMKFEHAPKISFNVHYNSWNYTCLQYEWSHKYNETWEKLTDFCPECGDANVWQSNKSSVEDTTQRLCVGCHHTWEAGDHYHIGNCDQNQQRVTAILTQYSHAT